MSDRKPLIEGYHKGEHRSAEEDSAYGRRETLSWKTISLYCETLIGQEAKAQQIIYERLGYKPQPFVSIPHEPFIRALIAQYEGGTLSLGEFNKQLEAQVKNIRNDDMEKNGWAISRTFEAEDFALYETELSAFKEPARMRLSVLLGYEPILQYSLYAELHLRQIFQFDWFHSAMPFCSWDNRTTTIHRYREALLEDGRDHANVSPLFKSL